jgi:chromosomal replication initiator protein
MFFLNISDNPQLFSMTTKNEIWNQIKCNIKSGIPKSEYETWLSQTSLLEISSELAVIGVPNKFVAVWLSENYNESIRLLLRNIVGAKPAIRFSYQTLRNRTKERKKYVQRSKTTSPLGLNPSHTFSDFIKARSNRLACSSALDVAKNPSTKYNPLYIFSKWSLGKTHLLHAIGNEAMKKDSHKKILYLSAENIVSKFDKTSLSNVYNFWGEEMPPRFLLLDDIHQAVVSLGYAQKELLSLCSLFLESKRQLVVTASSPPGKIKNLLPQLRSRLEWGLITEIKVPDQETKMKVIQQKAKQQGLQFPKEVQFFLAGSTNNLKSLVHKIEKIYNHAPIYGNKMDISTVQSILENKLHIQMGPERIKEITAKYFHISSSDLVGQNKERKIAYPRQVAIFLTRKYTNMSLKDIGKIFGNKHHSSIIYSISSIEKKMKSKASIIYDINKLKEFISNNAG